MSTLHKALQRLIDRHESLRTVISVEGGYPRQTVHTNAQPSLLESDLSRLSDPLQEVERLARNFVHERIDPSIGPLFSTHLYKILPKHHILVLALDHLITDGTSNGILVRDLWRLYQAESMGVGSQLPALKIQFPDYAFWQERAYSSWLVEHGPYWKRRLLGAPSIAIPTAVHLTGTSDPIGRVTTVHFDRCLTDQLKEIARHACVLLPVVMLSACAAVLSHWCRQGDMIIRFATHARTRPELRDIIGYLATLLYLRIEISETERFLSLVERVNLEFRAAYRHLDHGLAPELAAGYSNEVLFNWLPAHRHAPNEEKLGELMIERCPMELGWEPDLPQLCLFFNEQPDGILLSIRYRSDHLLPRTVAAFGCGLASFVKEIASRSSSDSVRIISERVCTSLQQEVHT